MEQTLLDFAKFAPDAPMIGLSGLDRCMQLVYHGGGYQMLREQVDFQTANPLSVIPGVRGFPSIGGVNPVFFGTATNLYLAEGVNPIVALGGVASVAATHWSWARFGNTIIAADQSNPLKGSTAFAPVVDIIASVLKPRMRYITVIKNHLFGGYTDDGAGGAFNGSQFWWSARNSATDWQPGSNRAGFASLRPDVGVISGVVGFEDFGLVFTEFAVYRIDWISGELVWSPRQIGSGPQGLPRDNEDSITVLGTDVYYWSRSGPAVVVGGESVQQLGVPGIIRRYLIDDYSTAPNAAVLGAADGDRPLVAWCWTVPGSQQNLGVIYNPAEDAWSAYEPPFVGSELLAGMCSSPEDLSVRSHPMDAIDWIVLDGTHVYRRRMSHDTVTCQKLTRLRTRRWAAEAGKRTQLHGIRLVWQPTQEDAADFPSIGDAAATITAYPFRGDEFAAETPIIFSTTSGQDANGYLVGPIAGSLPAEAQYWQFDISIQPFTGSLQSLVGLAVLHDAGSSLY